MKGNILREILLKPFYSPISFEKFKIEHFLQEHQKVKKVYRRIFI